jgi:ABC-2 type transport system ATP-binding protein
MVSVCFERVRKTFPKRFGVLGIAAGRQSETFALRDVTLEARAGEVLALLGPNGSGKTTLLKLASTMLLPDAGHILVSGIDAAAQPAKVRSRVGFAVALERSFYPRLTARENLDVFATLENVSSRERRERVAWALRAVELVESADVLVVKFSSGMQQRLGLARALLKRPSVLLLDEPTRSLDPVAAAHLVALVRDLAGAGACVIVATHNLEETLALGGRAAFLVRGELRREISLQSDLRVADLQRLYVAETAEADEPTTIPVPVLL